MSFERLPFAATPWTEGAHPLERKKVAPGSPAVVLELEPGFADPRWCDSGHVMYVLDGALGLELEVGHETITAGDGCTLDPGTRHRAYNAGDGVLRLFVVAR